MKIPATLFCFILYSSCFSQYDNTVLKENGLIYSEKTIDILTRLVDSLHKTYPRAGQSLTYKTMEQAKGHFIEMFGSICIEAVKDLEAGVSLRKFRKKYPDAEISSLKIIARDEYENYEGDQTISFSGIPSDSPFGTEIKFSENISKYQGEIKTKWVGYYYSYDTYSDTSSTKLMKEYRLIGYYLKSPFTNYTIPINYNKHIQYVEHLFDTVTTIFHEEASISDPWFNVISGQANPAIGIFMDYVHTITHYPMRDSTYDWKIYRDWYHNRVQNLKSSYLNDPKFQKLLISAVNEVLQNDFKYKETQGLFDDSLIRRTYSYSEFEEYVEYFFAPEIALEIKRNRIVYGECSMDEAPILHMINIARLAAKSGNWNVFFNTHMNILNDNIHRLVDSSFGKARRKTYLKEIEIIGVNMPELILGLSLRISNPSSRHYFGDVVRLGKALVESEYKSKIEKALITTISDRSLDMYNRVLLYYLFLNYADHLKDSQRLSYVEGFAKKAKLTFPKALREALN